MKANTADTITTALARRMEAAWQRYELERRQGVGHALPYLRRWFKLRAALECHLVAEEFTLAIPGEEAATEIPVAAGHSPAGNAGFVVYQDADGSAFLTVPVPTAVCRLLEGLSWRASLDAIVGNHFGILTFASCQRDPELQAVARDAFALERDRLSQLSAFPRRGLKPLRLRFDPGAWASYQHAAQETGLPIGRLVAGVLCSAWLDTVAKQIAATTATAEHSSLTTPSQPAHESPAK